MDRTRMIPKSHPLHRLFRGLTESTFMTELGIGDPSLVGYVAELACQFRAEPDGLADPRQAGPADRSGHPDGGRGRIGR